MKGSAALGRLALLFLFLTLGVLRPLPGAALEVPPLTGRVNDTAAMLSGQTVSELDGLLAGLEASDSTQLVVLTIPSLEGELLEDYSLRVAGAWGIGQKEFDNGALLLISRDDRRLRIEVGYGLEGSLTDLVAGRIIGGVIVPRFKEGHFDQGIRDGVEAMVRVVRGEFVASDLPASGQKGGSDPAGLLFMLIFASAFIGKALHGKKVVAAVAGGTAAPVMGLLFLPQLGPWLLALIPVGILGGILLSTLSPAGGGGGYYMGPGGFGSSSGGFGGGFGGGGGGFGGGGASGGW
ncbi:MAG: TPM domain-containing protein [Thermodesulfobacteriota bacterium]